MRKYNKPDLNAPRYRPKKLNLLNSDFCDRLRKDHPKLANLSDRQIKDVISGFNGKIWQTVIDERDGVELPEQLGYIFVGTCPRKKSNVDFNTSAKYGEIIQNRNWESDDYLAKIFYTNFETKYKFRHNDMWGFTGLRNFKRTVGQTYPINWKRYIIVDNLTRISRLFRKEKEKHDKILETKTLLEDYDEFNLE